MLFELRADQPTDPGIANTPLERSRVAPRKAPDRTIEAATDGNGETWVRWRAGMVDLHCCSR